MYRKKCLSVREVEKFLDASSDDEENTHLKVSAAFKTNIIVLSPEDIEVLSGDEELDENVLILNDENIFPEELADTVELESRYFSLDETNGDFEEQDGIHSEARNNASFIYRPPKWSKSHRLEFSKTPVDVSNEKICKIYKKNW